MALAAAEPALAVDVADLVERNMALVHYVIRRHFRDLPPGYDADDLAQAGAVALWRAALTWRPELGRFAPWACRRIRWRIGHLLSLRRHRPLPQSRAVNGGGEVRDPLLLAPAPEDHGL